MPLSNRQYQPNSKLRLHMNLLLLTESDFLDNQRARIEGARVRHINTVHGAKPGDTLRAGLVGGLCGTATITELGERHALLDVVLDTPPPPKLPLTVVMALPRPKMLRRIVRTIAECGVARLHLINSYRVEKSYWQTPVLKQEMLRDYLLQGLEQSRDTVLPTIELHNRFKPFVEDTLPSIIRGTRALVGDPLAATACPFQIDTPVTLAIGPEGGFIPYEVALLKTQGFETVNLGARIYRVDTVLPLLIGRLFG
jgi:RsmE family RNA methyltransferase